MVGAPLVLWALRRMGLPPDARNKAEGELVERILEAAEQHNFSSFEQQAFWVLKAFLREYAGRILFLVSW